MRAAEALREALEASALVRRCSERIGARTRFPACALAEMGRCAAPCEGRVSAEEYAALASPVASALDGLPLDALASLETQMTRLAALRRFEEAASMRRRIGSIVDAVARQRAAVALREAGRLRVRFGDVTLTIADGVLVAVEGAGLPVPPDGHPDEPRLVASWLARNRPAVVDASGALGVPVEAGRVLAGWNARLKAAVR